MEMRRISIARPTEPTTYRSLESGESAKPLPVTTRATTFATRPELGEINSIREDEPRCELPATATSGGSAAAAGRSGCVPPRSEEHTSELQSQFHLVCRLL